MKTTLRKRSENVTKTLPKPETSRDWASLGQPGYGRPGQAGRVGPASPLPSHAVVASRFRCSLAGPSARPARTGLSQDTKKTLQKRLKNVYNTLGEYDGGTGTDTTCRSPRSRRPHDLFSDSFCDLACPSRTRPDRRWARYLGRAHAHGYLDHEFRSLCGSCNR